jgi:AcrR family transcriptional regulator
MTLYNHFPSKNALVAAVLARRHDRCMATVDAAVGAAPDGRATWSLVEAYGDWLHAVGQHGCIIMKALGEFAEHAPEIRDQALVAKRDVRERLADALARDGYPTDGGLVERLFLVLEGANAGVPLLGAEATLRQTRQTIETLLTSPSNPNEMEA